MLFIILSILHLPISISSSIETMRAFTLSLLPAAILFNGALATWNDKICEGAGGCLGITWFPNTDYTCPGDILITNQEVAQNLISTESGVYTVISADEFPDSCEKESPDSNDYLVVCSEHMYTSAFREKKWKGLHPHGNIQ